MSRTGFIAALLAATLVSGGAWAKTIQFSANMEPTSEVPPTDSKASGQVLATLNTATKTLEYTATYNGLASPATMAHFHGPAPVGKNAGVAVPFPQPVHSPMTEKVTLTAKQMADLEAGMWYANVHNKQHPAGAIRGQMMMVK